MNKCAKFHKDSPSGKKVKFNFVRAIEAFGDGRFCVQLCIETLCKRATSVAHLTNFSFEFVYDIFTEDASLLLLYHGAKKSKMTKNSNQGGPALIIERSVGSRGALVSAALSERKVACGFDPDDQWLSDLSQAYLQLTLNEESRKFTTVNTLRGLFQFRRMPFSVASASAIFQRTIESVVRGGPRMVVRADDILVVDWIMKNIYSMWMKCWVDWSAQACVPSARSADSCYPK